MSKKTESNDTKRIEYEREANHLAREYCPPIYPCAKCGHPVIDGYCCAFCGDSNPQSKED